jgi:hypothetical protein
MSRYNRRSLPDYDGRRDDRGQGGGYRSEGYRGHGGGRGPSDRQNNTSRPTECRVVVNYNTLTTTDPPDEVDICVYNVAIKSGYWKAQLDENGKKKFNPDTGKIERNFITRSNYVCDDERFEKRFFSSPKPWRIYKTLLKNEQAKNPSFHLDVSNYIDNAFLYLYFNLWYLIYCSNYSMTELLWHWHHHPALQMTISQHIKFALKEIVMQTTEMLTCKLYLFVPDMVV